MRAKAPSQAHRFAPLFTLGVALTMSLASATAFAGQHERYDDYDDRYASRYEDDSRYAGQNTGRSDYAQVLESRPIYRQVRVSEPRRECWDERVSYREPRVAGQNAAGAILGGIIGGVAGNQFGRGSGRSVATGVGAVIGASLGSRAGEYDRGGLVRTGYETQCRTVDQARIEDRVDGYDVTYRYNGGVYHTTLPYDPGNRLAVDVDVRPVRY